MLKLDKSKKMELAATGFLSITSLVALVFATFSWFVVDKDVDATSTATILDYDDILDIDYTIYKYDLDNEEVITGDSSSDTLSLANLSLNKYDAVFTDQNVWNPVIVRFELSSQAYQNSSGYLDLTLTRLLDELDFNNVSNDDEQSLAALFSNVCSMNVGFGFTLSGNTPDDIYNSALTYFNATAQQSNAQSFVSGDYGNYSKAEYIGFDQPFTSSNWSIVDSRSVLYVYLYISYNPTLTQSYIDHRSDNSILDIVSHGINISVTNDIQAIKIRIN